MNLFRKPEVKTLADWLEIATHKLAAPAKERIKVEIEAHYAESVEAHIENGFSRSEAELAALAELGDARSSARSLRKRHLTEFEASALKSAHKTARGRYTLLSGYFAFLVFALNQQLPSSYTICRSPFLFLLVEFLVAVVLPTVCFVLSKSDGKRLRPRWLALVRPVIGPTAAFIIDMLSSPFLDSDIQKLTMLVCVMPLIQVLIAFRIWRKLGFAGTTHPQEPPFDTPCI